MEVLIGEKERLGTRGASKPTRENDEEKAIYDRRARGGPFNKGDHVWLFSPAVPPGRCKNSTTPGKGRL